MSSRGFARGRSAALVSRRVSFLATVCGAALFGLGGEAFAAACGPTAFTYGGSDWCTDRADTAYHTVVNNVGGRDGVLDLGIKQYTDSPWDPIGFYETEGYKTVTGSPVGQNTFVSGDIYIPASWQAQTTAFQSVGLWATLGVAPTGPATSYPIVNFFNGAVGGGKIRYWDTDHYEDAVGATINYDGWNTFRVNYLPGPAIGTGSFQIVVNGDVVGTITGGDFVTSPVDPATDSQYEVILNAHTNGLSAYDAFWSKMMWSLSESYYDAASIAPSAIAAGDMILGTYVDRRGLDWNGGKSAWMHAVSGNTKFDDGAGTLDSSITGTQFGLDLLALGDPSTRAGVTFGYTSQSTDIVLPDGMTSGGSTEGRLPSIGGYLTHADDKFYSDLLSQYRFINYDVNAPTSTGKVSGGAVDVVAEAGMHFGGGPITVTPLGQLSYQHLMLDDTTLGGSQVDFGDSDSLIGRARLLIQASMAGFKAYASAGVSSDLLGGKKTTVDSTDFSTTIGDTRGEFAAGVEASLGGLSIFGSGEYDVSFDGNSTTYAGRGGFRAGF